MDGSPRRLITSSPNLLHSSWLGRSRRRLPRAVVRDIQNRRALMARSISDPFRGAGMLHSVMTKPRPGTTVSVILFATLGTCGAQADDAVKPGKWAFSAVVSEPRAPLGAELGSNGIALRETECITSDDPLPPMARGPSTPRDGRQACKIDQ